MTVRLKGRVWRLGDNVDTDVILPGPYLTLTDPYQLAAHALEGLGIDFAQRVRPGDIIVAGRNFGCGSSREQAPVALKYAGVGAVLADSFARIFYRNAINIGLPIFESPEAALKIQAGDLVQVQADSGLITNLSRGETYLATPFPPFMQEIIRAGGLLNYVAARLGRRD